MRAVQVRALDGPAAVAVGQTDVPGAGPGQVTVDVHAAGVNFPDLLMTRGLYQDRPDPPFTLGCEVAGTVRQTGPGAGWQPGQRVAGYCGTGGLAEVAVVDGEALFELPDSVPCAVGAALSMNTFTAHFALRRRGWLRAGEHVLVHGAGGAVGSAAVQVAAALGGRVLAVASTAEKRRLAVAAGAVEAVPAEEFPSAARELTEGAGMDVVVDPVGGTTFTDSLRALAPEGRLLVLGFAAGAIPVVKVNRLLLNNLSVVGVGWGAFARVRPGSVRDQWAELAPLVVARRVWPSLGDPRALEDVPAVLTAIEERRSLGQATVAVRRCVCGSERAA